MGESATRAERDWRWDRVRQFMDARGLDGLLVFGSGDRPFADHYLTNERCGLTVVFPREGEIAAVGGMGPITNYAGSYLVSAERGEDTSVRRRTTGRGRERAPARRHCALEEGRV